MDPDVIDILDESDELEGESVAQTATMSINDDGESNLPRTLSRMCDLTYSSRRKLHAAAEMVKNGSALSEAINDILDDTNNKINSLIGAIDPQLQVQNALRNVQYKTTTDEHAQVLSDLMQQMFQGLQVRQQITNLHLIKANEDHENNICTLLEFPLRSSIINLKSALKGINHLRCLIFVQKKTRLPKPLTEVGKKFVADVGKHLNYIRTGLREYYEEEKFVTLRLPSLTETELLEKAQQTEFYYQFIPFSLIPDLKHIVENVTKIEIMYSKYSNFEQALKPQLDKPAYTVQLADLKYTHYERTDEPQLIYSVISCEMINLIFQMALTLTETKRNNDNLRNMLISTLDDPEVVERVKPAQLYKNLRKCAVKIFELDESLESIKHQWIRLPFWFMLHKDFVGRVLDHSVSNYYDPMHISYFMVHENILLNKKRKPEP